MNFAGGRPPANLGTYEPLMELAAGGMATVYVARKSGSAGFSRLVVVKRVHPHLLGNREFHDMFRDEARVASHIHHPNVVPVTDVVELESELLLVMEYIDSVSLGTITKEATARGEVLPPPVAARIVLDALAGLHAAHEAVDMLGAPLHVVHRDVSPQNIIVGADGMSRIIDFGIAQAAHRLTDETKTGSLKGKLAYMAPEQAAGEKGIDRRIDLFAAGVVLYETLAGKRLFRGENDVDTLKRLLDMHVPPPSAHAPGIPKELDDVTMQAIARRPDDRFPTAHAFHEALERAISPASFRDVAVSVQRYAKDRLDQRARRLRAVLEGSMPAGALIGIPLAPSSNPSVSGSRSGPISAPAADPSSDRSGERSGTSASVSLPSLEPAPPPRPKRSFFFFAGMSSVLLVALGVGVGLYVSARGRHWMPSAAAPVAAPEPPAAASVATTVAAPPSDSVAQTAAPPPTASAPSTPSAIASSIASSTPPPAHAAPPVSRTWSAHPKPAPDTSKETAKKKKPGELQDNPYK